MIQRLSFLVLLVYAQSSLSIELRPRKKIKLDDSVEPVCDPIVWHKDLGKPNEATQRIAVSLVTILRKLNKDFPHNPIFLYLAHFDSECYKDPQWIIDIGDEEGHTALHTAVANKNVAVIRKLHALGANPNVTDSIGRTPLHYAAVRGYVGIVKFLLAECNADAHKLDVFNATAYDLAKAHDFKKTLKAIEELQLPKGFDTLWSEFFQI